MRTIVIPKYYRHPLRSSDAKILEDVKDPHKFLAKVSIPDVTVI